MGFTVDLSGFEKMQKQYQNLAKDFEGFLRDFLIQMAERILAKTKPKTPVDTGALKSAWTLGDIYGSGRDLYIEILNPMEYATEIEYGHRIVAGSGADKHEVGWYDGHFMLKTSIDEIERQMPARFEAQFRAFCKAHGIGD